MFDTMHFTISICHHIFLDKQGDLVISNEAVSYEDAKRSGISPVYIYSLVLAGSKLKYQQYYPVSEPKSYELFLKQAWIEHGDVLFLPENLKVNKDICKSAPNLGKSLKDIGVELIEVTGKDRSYTATLIAGHKHRAYYCHNFDKDLYTIDELNSKANSSIRLVPGFIPSEFNNLSELEAYDEIKTQREGLTERAKGLKASDLDNDHIHLTGQKSIPPVSGIKITGKSGSKTLSVKVSNIDKEMINFQKAIMEELRAVINSHPLSLRFIGLQADIEESRFRQILQNKLSFTDDEYRWLGNFLDFGIKRYEGYDEYYSVPQLTGRHILNPKTAKDVRNLTGLFENYDEAIARCELVNEEPDSAETGYRYFLFNCDHYNMMVLLVKEGCTAEKACAMAFSDDGENIKSVSNGLLEDLHKVVDSFENADKNCLNIRNAFFKAHGKELCSIQIDEYFWQEIPAPDHFYHNSQEEYLYTGREPDDSSEEKEETHPADALYESANGAPFHEWIVSFQDTPKGWWGYGYITHAAEPFFVAKWGFVSNKEASAFGRGLDVGNGRSLVTLNCTNYESEETDYELLEEKQNESLSVIVEHIVRQQQEAKD